MAEARRARLRVRLGAAAVLVLVALGGVVLAAVLTDPGSSIEVAPTAVAPVSSGAVLYIHVLGAVERAGLYEVREGDRVIDAIAAAGGFRDDADQGQLNLARRLVDGEQLVVPVQGATPAAPGSADGRINLNTADAASSTPSRAWAPRWPRASSPTATRTARSRASTICSASRGSARRRSRACGIW